MGLGIKTALMRRTKHHRLALKRWPGLIHTFKNHGQVFRDLWSKKTISAVLRNGVRFQGAANNDVVSLVNDIWVDRCYAFPELTLGKNDCVVDIGANIGVFSTWAAQQTQGRIIAYEPFLENFKLLNENIKLNDAANVETHHCAVHGQSGTHSLYVNFHGGGHTLSDQYTKNRTDQVITVPTISLNELMEKEKLAVIDFLKIDCEGSEYDILPAASRNTLGRIRHMAVEYHDATLHQHAILERLLKDAGFHVRIAPSSLYGGYLYAWHA